MQATSSAKQQYETLMNNIAQQKGLHNLPKKDLNQIAQDLGLTNLKKNEVVHSISSKLVQIILTQNTLDMPNHPTIESYPVLKEVIKGFFELFSPGKQSNFNAQSQQQQQQQQQQSQYLQQLMELYGQNSNPNQSQIYQYLMLQASQQPNQSLLPPSTSQAQLQQLLYSQYPSNTSQLQQLQQLLAQQQQQHSAQQLQQTPSALSLQLQQAAAAGGVLSSSGLTPQQQLYYQQCLSDPAFTSLPQAQQQYLLQQIQLQQQQQQQQQAQQYQLSSTQQLANQTAQQQQQQQLLQQQVTASLLQQQQQQQLLQQQAQYNQQLYLQQQQNAQQNPQAGGNKQELSKTECICFSCDRLNHDLNKLREEEKQNKAIQCITCNNTFHALCVKVSANSEQSRIFECPRCTLEKLDPLNKPIETIQTPTIISGSGSITYFQVPNELYIKLGKKNHIVEVRCIRIDGTKNMYETTWPDSAECSLNQHKLKEYIPLQQNSSLKKRKDEKYNIKDVSLIQKGWNLIQIKENTHSHSKTSYRIDPNAIHVFGIYLVKKVPHSEFISQIPIRSEEDCKEIIKKQFVQASERQKQKILIEQQKQQQILLKQQENSQIKNEQQNQKSEGENKLDKNTNGELAGEKIDIETEGDKKKDTTNDINNIPEKEIKPQQQQNDNNEKDVKDVKEEGDNKKNEKEQENKMVVEDTKSDIVNGQKTEKIEETKPETQDLEKPKSTEPEKMDIEEQQKEVQNDEKKEENLKTEEHIKKEKIEKEEEINEGKEEEKIIQEEVKKPVVEVEINDNDEKENLLSDEDEEDNCISIDKLNVSLNCPYNFNTIKTPAKGKHCKHVQCFSLENMILFTESTVPRKWRCPICKLKCYEIVIDSYLQKIIQSYKEQNIAVSEISFDKDANYEIHKLKNDEDDDEDDLDIQVTAKKPTNAVASQETKKDSEKTELTKVKENGENQDKQNITNESQKEGVEKDSTNQGQPVEQGEGDQKKNQKKSSINADPVVIDDEDEEDSEEKKKQLQQKLNMLIPQEFGAALTNGKSKKQSNKTEKLQQGEKENEKKDDVMNIENINEEEENQDKLNETNKGGEISKEKIEIPESYFQLKEKLSKGIENSQNVFSDDFTFEEFQQTQTDKVIDIKLKSVRQSCRNKITKNLKKQYPELVNLIKKDAPMQAITSLEQYEQSTNRRNNMYGGLSDYSKILGNSTKDTVPSKNKNVKASSGLHTGATSATLQLPSSIYGYDMLVAQNLISPFSSNAFNIFGQRNPSTYNFIPITSQQTTSGSIPGSQVSAAAASNLNQFVNPLAAVTGTGVTSTNPTGASLASAVTMPSTDAAAAQQYYQLLEQQSDLSSLFNQSQFGLGGQSNLASLLNAALLNQPNAYSATAATDPNLYNYNLAMYGNHLGGQNNIALPSITGSTGVASNAPKKAQKQKNSSSTNKKSNGTTAAAGNNGVASKGTAANVDVQKKGNLDDPICLEDD